MAFNQGAPVSDTNPMPVAVISGGGGGGGASTIADGADVAEGATTDAVVAAGAAGSVSAKLRRVTTDLAAFATATHADLIAATPAGANLIGKVGIDQTTPGTTNGVVATGNVAAGVTDAGNPVKIGAVYNSTPPTVTPGQRGDLQMDSRGGLVVGLKNPGSAVYAVVFALAGDGNTASTGSLSVNSQDLVYNSSGTYDRTRGDTNGAVSQPHAMAPSRWSYAAVTGGIVNTATAVTIAAAAGAGIRNYLVSIQIDNDTLGAATEFAVRDGAAGAVLWRGKLQTAAGSRTYTFPVPLKGTANTLMEVVTLTAVTGGVFFSGQGFTGT